MTKLGIQMIEMYVRMIEQEFEPVLARLEERISPQVKDEIEKQAKIDLGIYDMYMRREALQLEINEISNRIQRYEWSRSRSGSILEDEVTKRIKQLNPPWGAAVALREQILKQIKLAGVPSEVRDAFLQAAQEIVRIRRDAEKLPPISFRAKKTISIGKGKKHIQKEEE